jgi:hypothetical protein
VHARLGLGVAGPPFAREGAAGEDGSIGAAARGVRRLVERGDDGVDALEEEGQVCAGIDVKRTENDLARDIGGVLLLLLELKQPVSPGADDDLRGRRVSARAPHRTARAGSPAL